MSTKPNSQDPENLISKSAKGATFLFIGSIFTKLITFILNQILITFISPKIFGINSFLEFLINTVLFFSREGIRLSSQRINDSITHDEDEDVEYTEKDKYNHNKISHGSKIATLQSIINLSFIPIMIGFPMSLFIIYWQYNKISEFFSHMELFNLSLLVIWFTILVELLVEPFYNLNQFNLNYDKRTRFESLAITINCFVNFGIVFWFKDSPVDGIPILAFSIGKLSHSLVLLISYYMDFRSYKSITPTASKLSLSITKIHNNENYYIFDKEAINHFIKIFFQLCFKHLLTEGDKLVINQFCTIEEQGIYSLISNYGSLLARLIFAPVEESLRNFLTRLLLTNKSSKNLNLSIDILRKIILFYIYLSIIIIIFGPLNSGYLIQKIIGNNWSNHVSEIIPLYTLYLPLLAFNGILESVHQSTASGSEVVNYTWFMCYFSGVFVFTSWLGIYKFELSLLGLIGSNMINMILRIWYCNEFIQHFYKKNMVSRKILKFDLNLQKILSFGGVIWGLDLLLFGITRNLKELIGNVLLAGILVGFIIYKEQKLIFGMLKRKPLTE
ncbi:Oligosaccharide translocation protein RFT1 [Wickerhamomyces ciferrii]|uniref:Man(5)GlcNAc(2)-PP-dolichol translocation protein RFT1 n=1 Tax=Wickerhamomyces ciferrii (strain ATCC 14091 / BCRC 22168 / CBS 111 / JCM 3599 / NBRC 0793 / NRRL Y-1031 F-60-10) TaxID=1206466 RepID=K0KXV3_WICCF|nr:Oligosaccharide translocation protein RFT1 [Wickerhamomyces ciferrii]CCH46892.1 Oligosaccharide translocation protein RFT1 [Wickerhamomyces ciferrii]